jgi:hypothetical protein
MAKKSQAQANIESFLKESWMIDGDVVHVSNSNAEVKTCKNSTTFKLTNTKRGVFFITIHTP